MSNSGGPFKSTCGRQLMVVPIPTAVALMANFPVVAVKTELWSMVIPKDSAHKEPARDLIVALSAKESTPEVALNGNGSSVRASIYPDNRIFQMTLLHSPWACSAAPITSTRAPSPSVP